MACELCVCVCLVKAYLRFTSLCVLCAYVCLKIFGFMEKVARARRARAHKRQAHTLQYLVMCARVRHCDLLEDRAGQTSWRSCFMAILYSTLYKPYMSL